jgi:hypothetical protein
MMGRGSQGQMKLKGSRTGQSKVICRRAAQWLVLRGVAETLGRSQLHLSSCPMQRVQVMAAPDPTASCLNLLARPFGKLGLKHVLWLTISHRVHRHGNRTQISIASPPVRVQCLELCAHCHRSVQKPRRVVRREGGETRMEVHERIEWPSSGRFALF